MLIFGNELLQNEVRNNYKRIIDWFNVDTINNYTILVIVYFYNNIFL